MTSFLDGLKKMIQGKPIFESTSTTSSTPEVTRIQQQPEYNRAVEKPLVVIDRVEYTQRGTEMLLNMHIRNRSRERVILQKIEALGNSRGLGITLEPGQSKEIRDVYRGPLLPNSNDRHVDVEYKGADGEFFMTVHRAEYVQDANNAFGIDGVRYEPPIRNI